MISSVFGTVYYRFLTLPISMGDRNALHLNNLSTGSIRIGVTEGSFGIGSNDISYWKIERGGGVFVEDRCYLGRGCRITVGKNAQLRFGHNFVSNAKCTISACKKIEFGNDCLLGWNCILIDGDGHRIVKSDKSIINYPEEVIIGNHVWIAANVTVLKGTNVKDNSVIALGAILSKKFSEKNVLIAGIPGKIVKREINWEHQGFRC